MHSTDDLLRVYEELYVPAYANYVAVTNIKNIQIITEESNAFTHVMRALNPTLPEEVRSDNIGKAYNHVLRATLDSHKGLTIYLHDLLNRLIFLTPNGAMCFSCKRNDVVNEFNSFIESIKKAREHETANVGVAPEITIEKYIEAVNIGSNLLEKYDKDTAAQLSQLSRREAWNARFWGFCGGVLASIVAAILLDIWTTPAQAIKEWWASNSIMK
jgi:hypothetical protein